MVDLFRTRKWDLVGKRNWWFALSLLVIVPGFIALLQHGLNYGIDFTGGGLITYKLAEPMSASEAESSEQLAQALKQKTGVEVRVQIAGDTTRGDRKDQILVRTMIRGGGQKTDEILTEQDQKITAALAQDYPGIREVAREMVSAVFSAELLTKAIQAVLWGCVFILLWIRLRYFDFKWAFSGVVALAHDVLVLIGVFALTHREVNSPFVAAALTVVGFSVHDTIIIFDRIRENLRLRKGGSFAETANISLLETLARSVNTVLTVVFVLLAVYFFGGATLRDFTFAMLIGVITGAYSSIFNASQLLVVLKNREERALAQRRAAQSARGRAVARGQAAPSQSAAPKPRPVTPKPAAPEVERAYNASSGDEAAAEPEDEAERAAKTARKKAKAAGKRKRRF